MRAVLIDSGLDVMAKDSKGLTPLMKLWSSSSCRYYFLSTSRELYRSATRNILERYPSAEAKEQERRELAKIVQGLTEESKDDLEAILRDLGENLQDQEEPLDKTPENVDTGCILSEEVDASDLDDDGGGDDDDNDDDDDDEIANKRKRMDDSAEDSDDMDSDMPRSQQKRPKIE